MCPYIHEQDSTDQSISICVSPSISAPSPLSLTLPICMSVGLCLFLSLSPYLSLRLSQERENKLGKKRDGEKEILGKD